MILVMGIPKRRDPIPWKPNFESHSACLLSTSGSGMLFVLLAFGREYRGQFKQLGFMPKDLQFRV